MADIGHTQTSPKGDNSIKHQQSRTEGCPHVQTILPRIKTYLRDRNIELSSSILH